MKKLKLFISVITAILILTAAMTASAVDELKIVYNVGVAPLKFEDAASRPAGLFPDTWRLWAKKAGKQIQFVKAESFEESLQLLKDGKVDLHAGLFKTPEREAFLDYSEQLLALEYYIFTHPSVHLIKSLEKTSGFIVGIQKGGYTERFVRSKVPSDRIVVYDRFQDLFRAALEGEIKVFVATKLSLLYYLKENWLTNIFEYDLDHPLFSQVYYTATRKGNPALIQRVNDGLRAISSEEKQQLDDRWIVQDFPEIPEESAAALSEKDKISLTDAERRWLKEHPVIRVHNEKDWPPFNYFEYGSPRGLSIDYMNLVAKQLGLRVEYVTGPSWNEFLEMVKRKELDVMLNIVKTEDRMKYLLFTEPYIRNPNVIVSSQKSPHETIEQLFGKTVAFPKGFFYEEVFTKSFPRIKRLPVEDTLASLKAVTFGSANAALGEAAVVRTLINKNLLSGLQISGEVNIGNPDLTNLRIGVRDDWPLLHSALMKAMAAVTPQEMNQIRQKWIVVDVEPTSKQTAVPISYTRLIGYGIVVFLILSLLAWILIKTIKKEHIAVSFGSRWFRGLVLAGLSFSVIIVCLLGWLTLERNKEKILAGVGENLKEILKTADDRLNLWVEQRTNFLKLLGRDPELVILAKRLLAVTPEREDLMASDALPDVRTFFENKKDIFSNIGFFIINSNYVSIGSMRDSNIGTRNLISLQKPDLLRRAFEGEVLFVPPIESDVPLGNIPKADGDGNPPTKFFMGPIRDTNGQIIAVMTLRVDPLKDFSRVIPFSETRRTGETYAFSQHGELLSESRFDEQLRRIGLIEEDQQSASNVAIQDPGVNLVEGQRPTIERSQQPLTRMASRAIQLKLNMENAGQTYGRSKIEVDTEGYRDYRGVPVFGAWLWNADMGLGLATEIDVNEAMSNYYQIRWTVIGVLGFTLLLSVSAVLLVLILGERTSRALMKARDNLEEKVEERTAELEERQEHLKAAVERSRLILDSAGEGIFGVDQDGKVVFINPAANRMLGYGPDELHGQDVHQKIHHSHSDGSVYPKKECPMYLTHADGSDHHVTDEVLWRKDGSSLPVEYNSMPIKKDDQIVGAVVTFMDITARKQMELEIFMAKEKAVAATQAKSDFLANMSHEIRTPMNAVMGLAHLALKSDLSPKQRDYLNKIQSSANSLLGIINDILDFSKIEAGKLEMESVEFNLEDVLDNLANLVAVKAQEQENLEVLFAPAPEVPRFLVGDPLRLGQVLINLANNAVKFTESGEIVVATELLEENEDEVRLKFSVSDTGIGLSQKQIDRLFETFSQADTSTTRKYGGTGLGLTISQRLVNMMGGEIWVESEPGQGSKFHFTATFGLGQEPEERRFAPSPDLRGMRVLVVDDNPTSRNILQGMLESFSFEVNLAASGEEGLAEIERAAEGAPFELVVMDWKMPGMDGIEASRRIKGHPGLEKIPPIILVTAYGREEIMQEADEAGLDGFLLKPVSPSILFDTIMQATGKDTVKRVPAVRDREQEVEELEHIRGARVLLVDDNEINQQVAQEILEGAGLVVTVAGDGQEAVNAVKASEYDAVLMDIQMPVMDGYEATREIRNSKSEIRNIPIIAMTAHAMSGDREKTLEAGMNDHVTKPIDPDQLFSVLGKCIQPVEDRGEISLPETVEPDVDAAEEYLPDSLPGFDIAAGLTRLQGNRRLYRKLLLDFAAENVGVAGEIQEALDEKDIEHAYSLVHNLKGLAGNLSATDLLNASGEIEKLIKSRETTPSPDAIERGLKGLENALIRALESIRVLGPPAEEEMTENLAEKMESIPPELAKKAAKRLREAVESGAIMELKSIAEELKSQSDSFTPISERIIRMAENFDFDGISELADELENLSPV